MAEKKEAVKRSARSKVKKPHGRPTKYTEELGEYICSRVASCGYGLDKLWREDERFPNPSTIYLWRAKHERFSKDYAAAKLRQAEVLAEEILDISDDGRGDLRQTKDGEVVNAEVVQRSRLRVDTRKWIASKLLPKAYGDFKQIEDLNNENKELREELRSLRSQLDKEYKKEY